LPVQEVARRASASRPAVWRWQARYAEQGVEGSKACCAKEERRHRRTRPLPPAEAEAAIGDRYWGLPRWLRIAAYEMLAFSASHCRGRLTRPAGHWGNRSKDMTGFRDNCIAAEVFKI
jgi:hypothetical protein